MSAISITAANVAYVSGPVQDGQIAGEAFTAGMAIYKADNNTWLKAQGDGTAVQAGANELGIALADAAAAGARVSVAKAGAVVAYGSVITAGVIYIIGDTAGSIYPAADAGAGDKIAVLGVGVSATQLFFKPIYHAGSALAP